MQIANTIKAGSYISYNNTSSYFMEKLLAKMFGALEQFDKVQYKNI